MTNRLGNYDLILRGAGDILRRRLDERTRKSDDPLPDSPECVAGPGSTIEKERRL